MRAVATLALVTLTVACGAKAGMTGNSGGAGGAGETGGASGAVAGATGTGGTTGPGGGGGSRSDGGAEVYVPDFYIGSCSFVSGGVVPADAGTLLHGLKVIAEGITGAKGLEADGSNAYVAGATISRVPLGGGAAQTMVSHAMPVATAADATSLYWTDASVSGQTTVLRVPLTATGWEAFAGDAGSTQVATTLATKPGAPGAFTLADGYLYFGAGNTVWRVPTGGGTAQQVVTGIAPTGIAVRGDTVYVGDDPNEAIQYVGLTGMFAGVLGGFHSSNATPTQLALSGDYLYWGDWYGSVEYVPVAAPNSSWTSGRTPCGGGACILRMLRPMNGGVVWVSGDSSCSHIGKVDSAGSAYFATSLAVIGGLAVTETHVYAVTGAGQLLQLDL